MKRHVKSRGRPGMTYRNALCGLPERYADLGYSKGKVYDLDRYRDVPEDQVCKTCMRLARKAG